MLAHAQFTDESANPGMIGCERDPCSSQRRRKECVMSVTTTFGQVWTLEYLTQERIVEQLCEAARLATVDFTGSVPRLREILENLRLEVETLDAVRQPEAGLHRSPSRRWS